jgi:hypothetical protein
MDIQYLFKLENLFKMENTLANKLMQTISENEATFENDEMTLLFENAIKDFDILVEKGFAKKRENNLLSITDMHLHRITLDTIQSKIVQPNINMSGLTNVHFENKTNFNNSINFNSTI